MFKKLLNKIVVHRAALMLVGAGAGVAAAAYFAHEEGASGEEERLIKEKMSELDVKNEKDIPKKDRAIIFVKSHWRSGIAIIGTYGLMALSHRSMAKELAGATIALGMLGKNYKQMDEYFSKNFPKEDKEFKKKVKFDEIKKALSTEKKPKTVKNESYDGRQRYYEPWSCQIFFATDAEIKEAECTVNELIINTGAATLFDYLATFPSSSGVKLKPWMKYFGWYEGDTAYTYNSGYLGPYLKPIISKEKIIFKGEEEELFTISWENNPDLDPDLSAAEMRKIDDILASTDNDDEDDIVTEDVA